MFCFQTWRTISKPAVSHKREADGAPWPTWRASFRYQHCIWFNFFSVAGDISVHVPAPCNRLGTQQISHSNRAVSKPPTNFALQSLTMLVISIQAPRIFPSLAATVQATESDKPPDDRICPTWIGHKINYLDRGNTFKVCLVFALQLK